MLLSVLAGGCGGPKVSITEDTIYEQQDLTYVPAIYEIGPGDVLQIAYYSEYDQPIKQYHIQLEDKLVVNFFFYPELRSQVTVRPDGRVSLPLIGEVDVHGEEPGKLAKRLSDLYAPHLRRPQVTVDVVEFNKKLRELQQAITSESYGQVRNVLVRPDGFVSLPYVGDLKAAGQSPELLTTHLNLAYDEILHGLKTTVAVAEARSNLVYVVGQVGRPNFYELIGPTTVSQAVAMAGGFAADANTHEVVLITRTPDKRPMAKLLDMDDILGTGNLGNDLMLHQYDVIFVPRTSVHEAAITMDAIWHIIPLRFSANFTYGVNEAVEVFN